MQLSTHFSVEELTRSRIGARYGLDNTPGAAELAHLRVLCETLLEPVRSILSVPLHIDSGYRNTAINILDHGAVGSAHLDGRAADVVPVGLDLRSAFSWVRTIASTLPLDQAILECGAWLHLSIPPDGTAPRREFLTGAWHDGHWSYLPT